MKNLKVDVVKKGVEVLIVRITGELEDGKVYSRDVDLGGNGTSIAYWGMREAINAINDMNLPLAPLTGKCSLRGT
jgi:hypothetical protein